MRRGIAEFLGAESMEGPTAASLTHSDGCRISPAEIRPPGEIDWFLGRGLDISRSLLDTDSLLAHLDKAACCQQVLSEDLNHGQE